LLLFLLVSESISLQENTIANDIRWGILQRKVQERAVLRAFEIFREQNIEPVLIKGLAAARYYPESVPRLSVDIDLAVSHGDFEAATVLAASLAADGLAIDLHNELRHLDTVEWSDLFANSQLVEIDGVAVRVLRPEDHLRVLCVHWLNDGGGNKNRLADIYYRIENRSPDFDWDRFLQAVSPRRRRWLLCTIGLAHRYLQLDLDDTPIKERVLDLPGWLIKAVEREWASGTEAVPLWTILGDRKKLAQQIKMRLRPNPIRATIEMEGDFDAKTRIFYKIGNTFQRMLPSYRRISATLKGKTS